MLDVGRIYDAAVQLRAQVRKGIGVAPFPGSDQTQTARAVAGLAEDLTELEDAIADINGVTRLRTETVAVADAAAAAVRTARVKPSAASGIAVAESVTLVLA